MMKKLLLAALIVAVPLYAEDAPQTKELPSKAEIGRALGVLLASQLAEINNIPFDYDTLAEAMRNTYNGTPPISGDEAKNLLQTAYTLAMAKEAASNLEKSNAFLAENAKKSGVKTTSSGLQYEILQAGKNNKPAPESVVDVYYIGTLIDGTVFDSNKKGGDTEPQPIPLAQVIPGWAEGLQLIGEGGHIKLYIPPSLAYGEQSPSASIPPNSVLVFDVELVEIEDDEGGTD